MTVEERLDRIEAALYTLAKHSDSMQRIDLKAGPEGLKAIYDEQHGTWQALEQNRLARLGQLEAEAESLRRGALRETRTTLRSFER